jgi:hypothetical protein
VSQKWSKDIVIRSILERSRKQRKLGAYQIQQDDSPLYQAGCRYFGGWREAVEAAGLTYEDGRTNSANYPKVWDEKIIVETIRQMHNADEPLNSNYIQTECSRLYSAANVYFGGWSQALAAAGLDYAIIRKRILRSWTKVAIIEEIVQRAESRLSIRGLDVQRQDRGLYNAARRHFGKRGWAKGRMLAGFDPVDPNPRQKWNKENVCQEIRRLAENEVLLRAGVILAGPYSYIYSAGKTLFGNWPKAIRAAGLNYSKIRNGRQKGWWTKARVSMVIRSLDRRGVRLSSKTIHHSHGGLFAAAVFHFGSWSQAVEAAGISYRQHCRKWSTKAWLQRMQQYEYHAITKRAQVHAKKRRSKQ